jgi:hypothetical protein
MPVVRVGREHLTLVALTQSSSLSRISDLPDCKKTTPVRVGEGAGCGRAIGKTEMRPTELNRLEIHLQLDGCFLNRQNFC